MTMDELAASAARNVLIDLLDPSFEQTIKSWAFADRDLITIGRADDQDVEVGDAYVSRSHARLEFRNDGWVLVSTGRNGVLVESKPITEHVLKGEVKFRLGSSGPCFRFRTSGESNSMQTISDFDTLHVPTLHVDERKVTKEVGAIAACDYFQNLQQRARNLRQQRAARLTSDT
jgi:hypothetical protein